MAMGEIDCPGPKAPQQTITLARLPQPCFPVEIPVMLEPVAMS